jgi:hypothetical protein
MDEKRDPSELAKSTDADFRDFRRDAYAYRERVQGDLGKIQEEFRDAIDKIRSEATKTSRWVIGILVIIGIALGSVLIPNYSSLLQRIEHIAVRQDTIAEHALTQDKAIESLNSRLQLMERFQWGGKP